MLGLLDASCWIDGVEYRLTGKVPPHEPLQRLLAGGVAGAFSRTGQTPGPSLLPPHRARRMQVLLRAPSGHLSVCTTLHARGPAFARQLHSAGPGLQKTGAAQLACLARRGGGMACMQGHNNKNDVTPCAMQ